MQKIKVRNSLYTREQFGNDVRYYTIDKYGKNEVSPKMLVEELVITGGDLYNLKEIGMIEAWEIVKIFYGGEKKMKFIDNEHEKRFEELKNRNKNFSINDIERASALYIISANEELFCKSKELYDFEKEEFIFDLEKDEKGNYKIKWKTPLSSSEKNLITLAFDLFSSNNNIGVMQLFNTLDKNNIEIALRAIAYRFKK